MEPGSGAETPPTMDGGSPASVLGDVGARDALFTCGGEVAPTPTGFVLLGYATGGLAGRDHGGRADGPQRSHYTSTAPSAGRWHTKPVLKRGLLQFTLCFLPK